MTQPLGAALTPIPDAAPFLRALLEGDSDSLPEGLSDYGLRFAVLQCADTFVWGVPTSRGTGWVWSSGADPALRPPRLETLLEARVFGPNAEVLAWRDDPAFLNFMGRFATDGDMPKDAALAPLDRAACFAGHLKDLPGTPFQCWITGGGKVMVAPRGRRLHIREYLGECLETGVLRIAMTRFLEIT